MNRLLIVSLLLLLLFQMTYAASTYTYSSYGDSERLYRYVNYIWSCSDITRFSCADGYSAPCGTDCAGSCASSNCGSHGGGWTNAGKYGDCCTASGYSGTWCSDSGSGSRPRKRESYINYFTMYNCRYVSSTSNWTTCANHVTYAQSIGKSTTSSRTLSESTCNSLSKPTAVYCNRTPTQPIISLVPTGPKTTEDLTCTIAPPSTDPDGDVDTPLIYEFTWTSGSKSFVRTKSTLVDVLSNTEIVYPENWTCSVTARDNQGKSNSTSAVAAANVTVANTIVTKPTINISSNSRNAGATITCGATSTDPDVDEQTQDFIWGYTFYKNGNEITGFSPRNDWLVTSTVDGAGLYTCKAKVSDMYGNNDLSTDVSEISTVLEICGIYETWTGTECVANPTLGDNNTFVCAPKPIHSNWNNVATYVQTFDGTNWVPLGTQTIYSATSSDIKCYYICEDGFSLSGDECTGGTSFDCDLPTAGDESLIDHFVWTSNNESVWTQWIVDGVLTPTSSDIITEYAVGAANPEEPCKFICEAGYNWNGEDCVAELDYCGLVGLEMSVIALESGPDKMDLTFNINCSPSEDIPGGVDTILETFRFIDDDGITINDVSIGSACTQEVIEITRTMDTNNLGNFKATLFYGSEEFTCSRSLFFSSVENFDDREGPVLSVPDNNPVLIVILLLSVALIVTRKRKK